MATLTDALKEAYATAPPGVVTYHTLELYHPSWDDAVRIVQGFVVITATLEADAPLDASTAVEFSPCGFDFIPPEKGQGRKELTVTIDNVSRLLMDLLENADKDDPTPVRVTYRPFVSTDLSGPGMTPIHLDMGPVDADLFQVSATCIYNDLVNRKCPRKPYTSAEFPAALAPA